MSADTKLPRFSHFKTFFSPCSPYRSQRDSNPRFYDCSTSELPSLTNIILNTQIKDQRPSLPKADTICHQYWQLYKEF